MRERERDGRWWLGDDEESDRDSELVSMSTHLSAAALSSLPPQARVLSHTLFCPNSRPAPSLPRPLSHKSVLAIGSLSASWRPRQASRFSAWTRRKTKKIRVRSDAASESRGIVRWPGSGDGESRGPGTGLGWEDVWRSCKSSAAEDSLILEKLTLVTRAGECIGIETLHAVTCTPLPSLALSPPAGLPLRLTPQSQGPAQPLSHSSLW